MFVAIHELAHVMTKSIGHGDDFWNNMRYLLSVAIRTHAPKKYDPKSNFYTENMNGKPPEFIYTYEDYSQKSSPYCGTDISTTPCNNEDCTK